MRPLECQRELVDNDYDDVYRVSEEIATDHETYLTSGTALELAALDGHQLNKSVGLNQIG